MRCPGAHLQAQVLQGSRVVTCTEPDRSGAAPRCTHPEGSRRPWIICLLSPCLQFLPRRPPPSLPTRAGFVERTGYCRSYFVSHVVPVRKVASTGPRHPPLLLIACFFPPFVIKLSLCLRSALGPQPSRRWCSCHCRTDRQVKLGLSSCSSATSSPSLHPPAPFCRSLAPPTTLQGQHFHFSLHRAAFWISVYNQCSPAQQLAMASTNIPLHCSICPKRPDFSDVSHLLTHIASKGHLSNYYKVKVRSGNDDAARRLVESYDRWYAEWNVEDLMSERMTLKDKRRSRARPVGTYCHSLPGFTAECRACLITHVARQPSAPRIEAPVPRSARPRGAVGNYLDPRLSEQQMIKLENAATPTPTPQPGPVLRQRPPRVFGAHMQYWPGPDSRTF